MMRTTQSPVRAIVLFPFRLIAWLLRAIAGAFASLANEVREFFTEEVEDAPVMDALNKVIDQPMSAMEHLKALRKHLLRSVLFLMVTTAIAANYFDTIMVWISRSLPGGTESLQVIDVTEPISVFMRVALFGGFALAFPYIALELWLFVGPGLKRRTRIAGLFTIPVATLLFLAGVAFAYFVMLPTALPFLLGIGNF